MSQDGSLAEDALGCCPVSSVRLPLVDSCPLCPAACNRCRMSPLQATLHLVVTQPLRIPQRQHWGARSVPPASQCAAATLSSPSWSCARLRPCAAATLPPPWSRAKATSSCRLQAPSLRKRERHCHGCREPPQAPPADPGERHCHGG